MEFKLVKEVNGSVYLDIDGKEVVFEKQESLEKHEYSQTYAMDGFTKIGTKWEKTHEAEADFENGSDEFYHIENVVKLKPRID